MPSSSSHKAWALRRLIVGQLLKDLDSHFRRIAVRYMPIKGAYLICRSLAERMAVRRMADIDILVEDSGLAVATEYFFSLANVTPLTHFSANSRPYETQLCYKFAKADVPIELHSMVNFPQRFKLPVNELFERGTPRGEALVLPSAEDALLITACHILTHLPFEFRETWGEEIGLIASQEGFDWQRFWRLAHGTDVPSAVYFVLGLFLEDVRKTTHAPRGYWYSDLQLRLARIVRVDKLPYWYRRAFLEIPFVRDPLWLVAHKIRHRRPGRQTDCH
jgi:hypothetical protein